MFCLIRNFKEFCPPKRSLSRTRREQTGPSQPLTAQTQRNTVGTSNHRACWPSLPVIGISSPPENLLCFVPLPSWHYNQIFQATCLSNAWYGRQLSRSSYSVFSTDTMTLFSLCYYWHLSEPIFQQIGFLLQPGPGKPICHLEQVETGWLPKGIKKLVRKLEGKNFLWQSQ